MIVLASGSPRRKELLSLCGFDFTVSPADIDETLPEGVCPDNAAEFLAVQKAKAAAVLYPNDSIIGCDTVVICGGELLGKPIDEDGARQMLTLLSGRTHTVITGVCVIKGRSGINDTNALNGINGTSSKIISTACRTDVSFYDIPPKLMDAYIKTGSPLDKAGAYGIQDDIVKLFTKQIVGNLENVIGFPLSYFYKMFSSLL
jgi:septum formation protein